MGLPAFRVAQMVEGGTPHVREYTVAASPSVAFGIGDPVMLNGTDDAVDGVADDAAGPTITGVLGIAMQPSAGNEGKKILVTVISPGTVLSAKLDDTWAADMIGNHVSIARAAGPPIVYTLESTGVVTSVFKVVGRDNCDTDRALVTVLDAISQFADVAAT